MLRLFFVILLAGCSATPVAITDHVVYGDEGVFGAAAVHTLDTQAAPKVISATDWPALRLGMVCMKVADLNQIQKSIDTLCTEFTGACDYSIQKTISNTVSALSTHLAKTKAKKP